MGFSHINHPAIGDDMDDVADKELSMDDMDVMDDMDDNMDDPHGHGGNEAISCNLLVKRCQRSK